MRPRLPACSSLLGLLLLPVPALAGGYYYSDSGIVAAGRGGAFVAGADTQYAQHYNPAGLIRIEAPTLNIGYSGVKQGVHYQPWDQEEGVFLAEVDNEAPAFGVPQLGFVTPIGDSFAFAFGMYSPFAPSFDYDPDGAQRYSVIETAIYEFSWGPSLAWQPVEQFTIGVGLNIQAFWVTESLKITTSENLQPGNDVAIELAARDFFSPSFNAGVLIEPVEQLSIGLSFLPPVSFQAKGHALVDFTGHNLEPFLAQTIYQDGDCESSDENCTDPDGVTLAMTLPLTLRGGVAVRPIPALEIEAAVVYQHWKSLDDLVVDGVDIQIQSSLGESAVPDQFVIPQVLHDIVSFRLGAEYRVIDELELRVGGFYEPGAVPSTNITLALVDADKVQVGGGASVFLLDERLRFDVSAAGLFLQTEEIRNSQVVPLCAPPIEGVECEPPVTGNGDIASTGWIVGGQASWAFKKKER